MHTIHKHTFIHMNTITHMDIYEHTHSYNPRPVLILLMYTYLQKWLIKLVEKVRVVRLVTKIMVRTFYQHLKTKQKRP